MPGTEAAARSRICPLCGKRIRADASWTTIKDAAGSHHPAHTECQKRWPEKVLAFQEEEGTCPPT